MCMNIFQKRKKKEYDNIHLLNMFNRFENVQKNKLGLNSTFNIPMSMNEALSSAIPIWVLLGLTEEEYYEKHPLQRPAKQGLISANDKEEQKESDLQFPISDE